MELLYVKKQCESESMEEKTPFILIQNDKTATRLQYMWWLSLSEPFTWPWPLYPVQL